MENPCIKCLQDKTSCCGCPKYHEWKNKNSTNKFRGIVSPDRVLDQQRNLKIQNLIDAIDQKLISPNLVMNKGHFRFSFGTELYSKEIRDFVASLYLEKGWSKIEHKTSSENGELPGITIFEFYW